MPVVGKKARCRLNTDDIKLALIEYREREKEIINQTERLSLIDDRLTGLGTPSLSDMPRTPSPANDRIDRLLSIKLELEKDLLSKQEFQFEFRRHVEEVLKKIKKADERLVIRARYLDCSIYHQDRLTDWTDVSNLLFGGKLDYLEKEDSYLRRTHMIHKAALIEISAIVAEDSALLFP